MRPVLAIDIGSSAVRAAVMLPRRILAKESVQRGGAGSGMHFDPDELWGEVCRAVAALPEELRRGVGAIGLAGHIGAVAVDENLDQVGRACGWANAEGVDDLREALGGGAAEALGETGRPAIGGGPIATLLSLRRSRPTDYGRVAHVLAPKDYIIARMSGSVVTDHTSAAYYGASSIRDRAWSPRILSRLGVPERLLPAQRGSAEIVAAVASGAAQRLGIAAGTPIAAGGPDGTVGAMAVAGTRGDTIVDVAGTTDVLVRLVAAVPAQGGNETKNPYPLGRRWTVGGATGMTGGAVTWWANALGLGPIAQAVKTLRGRMEEIGPGSDGVVVLPWMSGSRYPRWRGDARGGVSGLRGEHGPAHVLRAAMEGAAFSVREGIDSIARGDRAVPVSFAGGAARSRWLVQLRADVLGRPVLATQEPDVSLVGAGQLALVATGSISEEDVAWADPREADVIEPSGKAAAYDEAYASWLDAALAADGL